MGEAVAHPLHQRPRVAEQPIPGGSVQTRQGLHPGGQPHAHGIDHQSFGCLAFFIAFFALGLAALMAVTGPLRRPPRP